MAYDAARRAYMPRASENYKNDDSSLGGYEDRLNIHHAAGHRNEEDQVYTREGTHQMVVTEGDDSMHEEPRTENRIENRQENGHFSNEENNNIDDPGLDVNENDDSSIEGHRTPFQNHQEAHANTEDDSRMGPVHANENDDAVTSEEHEFLANQLDKDRSYPLDFSENDDSSVEVYRTPFRNHQESHANDDDDVKMGLAPANENDDTVISEEHEFLANQLGKDLSYPLDFSENDDSSIEGYRTPFRNHQESHANDDDNVKMGLAPANENDDTVISEEHEFLANQLGKDLSYPLDFSENDDSSIEGYRTPFRNHQESHANDDDNVKMGLAPANENDDTVISEEHEFLANQLGKDRNYAAEVHSKRARLQVPCIYCCNVIR